MTYQKYDSVCDMPSGKGVSVRLVLITAICEGYHAPLPIDHHDNENEMLKALLVFKATRY